MGIRRPARGRVRQRTDSGQIGAQDRACTSPLQISADGIVEIDPGEWKSLFEGVFYANRTPDGDWNGLRGCTSKVSRALKSVSGVDDVQVSLADGDTTVRFNERLTSLVQLKSAVTKAGYGVDGVAQSKGGCCG